MSTLSLSAIDDDNAYLSVQHLPGGKVINTILETLLRKFVVGRQKFPELTKIRIMPGSNLHQTEDGT